MSMNFRWLWGNYVEPEWKLSRAEMRTVDRLVKKRYMRPRILFGLTAMWLVIIYGAVGLLAQPIADLLGGQGIVLSWLFSLILIIVPLTILAVWSFRWIYTRPVRRAMRDLGYDVCINCGYWLRGLDDDVKQCPECGHQREPMPAADNSPRVDQ